MLSCIAYGKLHETIERVLEKWCLQLPGRCELPCRRRRLHRRGPIGSDISPSSTTLTPGRFSGRLPNDTERLMHRYLHRPSSFVFPLERDIISVQRIEARNTK